jgi:lipopolysaccharide transport system ATP-binding protein
MSTFALKVEGLSKQYRIGGPVGGYKTFRESLTQLARHPLRRARSALKRSQKENAPRIWAIEDISFTVKPGEVVGVIGRNGAGKSTLLKVLSRITEPTKGYADVNGRIGSLLEVGTGFHPELTGRENIFLNGAILGMSRAEIHQQFDAIVAFAEVQKFIDTPVKHYSSGMYLRLAFAIAAHLEPEILLVDEVLAVGDVAFQKRCLGKMGEVAHQGRTVLFVSHNMGAVRSLCEKGLVLEKGKVLEFGHIGKAIETYYRLSEESGKQDGGRFSPGETGFGPVCLSSHEANSIDQGDPLEIATTLNIGQEIGGFVLLCVLEDMHQRAICHLRIDSPELSATAPTPGLYDIGLKLPALWLEPGLYSLYFKILFSGQAMQHRYLSDILYIDVGGASSGWGAALTPRTEWKFAVADTPAALVGGHKLA